ncbi:uncharacterized protein LOC113272427 [Papaver somniferum]|uniref:uncharacterized protein LOC113272427 n=1 Tax=Papaver somniferum TaxID=3469 RepID=UPI000E6FAD7F|nr:uncharacterized protein LOC113272427 [Papaver somniferum]
MAWVNWQIINLTKEQGGLGVKNFRIANKTLLAKWIWRYTKQKQSLRRNIVQQKTMATADIILPVEDNSTQGRSLWRNVTKLVPEIHSLFTFKIRNGRGASIAQMIRDGRWCGNFRHQLNANEQMEWDLLCRDIGLVPTLVYRDDEVDFTANYSNKLCYDTLAGNVPECCFSKFLWKNYIPPKVNFLLWAIFHNSLPTRVMLSHRRVELDSTDFPLCNNALESADHLLLHCSYSFKLWDYFIKSLIISWPMSGKVLQLFEAWECNVLAGRCMEHFALCRYMECLE